MTLGLASRSRKPFGASLGHVGDPNHPTVKAAVEDALARIVACGKPAGILRHKDDEIRRSAKKYTAFSFRRTMAPAPRRSR